MSTQSKSSPNDLPEIFNLEVLLEALGVSYDSVWRWERENKAPPCTRIGRQRIYRREAVLHWLIEREV